MLKMLKLVMFSGMLLFSSPAAALDWSCSDMKDFVDSLYELGDFIAKTPKFDESPRFESGMNTIVDVLDTIARDEEKPQFTSSVQAMKKLWNMDEWNNKQRNAFRRSFDAVSVGLERIHEQYCR
ncbi:MAG: hypothetical protein HQL84_04565 [Magnetococcales bacterium]|nr:hypothetical protein [Magnetococcales bacterium]MBF0149301.1 hypothetical protein [Magnetococcales bacterium]MBF0172312.1 hypothetical protein [Magnetococcales bacterium]MBF0349025.1 hypothetical protein [Magnetococcales bacterium]MBF0630671.1 hypothetical protein [Magnetococcales bacterium]